MSGALYRKYRPRKFSDVIDQRHITSTIENSIKNGTFAHAYLLTGPRGVGKTTVARLFAYSVNGLDYAKEQAYSDIIEIDAASNRRIDEIRELRDKISITPSMLKYKVYIIDEVHMLTREAFNALLKTLEEPPEHAIFILATTDFHKVPDTIASRCVRFAFSSISHESIKKHLSVIAKKEKINIEDEALKIIAENAEGSFRDAISLLDQFRGSGKIIKSSYVAQVLGLSPEKSIKSLLNAVESGQPKTVIDQLSSIRESGSNDTVLVGQLANYLRDCLAGEKKTSLSGQQIVGLSERLLKLNDYADMSLALELVLVEAALELQPKTPNPANKNVSPGKPKTVDESPAEPADMWQSVLGRLKNTNSTLYGIARMAEPKYNGEVLELYFKFPFHYKQMNIERNYLLLGEIAKSVKPTVNKVTVHMLETSNTPSTDNSEPLKNISNIFGSAEVIES